MVWKINKAKKKYEIEGNYNMKNVLKNTMLGLVSCLCLVGCGTVVVDDHRCIGCGLCTTRCKFDAITLHCDHPEASTMVGFYQIWLNVLQRLSLSRIVKKIENSLLNARKPIKKHKKRIDNARIRCCFPLY